MRPLLTAILFFLFTGFAFAQQQSFPLSDSIPITHNGLKAGYTITETSEKEVGDKGTFSRYKLKFFVTNTADEAKILMQKPNVLFSGSPSPHLATFKCSNATGARLTNKTADINMQQCNIEAAVEDKDCATGKTTTNHRIVNIGYWIKPGETISTNCIMITPLNEKPNMTVVFYPFFSGIVGTPFFAGSQHESISAQGFVRLKNFSNNKYIHNQNGPIECSDIDRSWGGAQWVILPVNGTNNFQIRSRLKSNFISTETSGLLSDNGQSSKAMWMIEETTTSNVFYIKNVADNSKLLLLNGVLKTSNSYNTNDATAQWVIEK